MTPAEVDDIDEPATADTVAELDDEPDTAADDDADELDASGPVYVGACHGGPWDGRTVLSRFERGIVRIDKEARLAWVYDRDPVGGDYRVRDGAGVPLDDEKRWQAAESEEWDVIAAGAEVDPSAGEEGA